MSILHAVGWGLVGFISMFLFLFLTANLTKSKIDAEIAGGVLQFSFITALAVFLLTL